ncbi:YdcF family protein [Nocardiopsis sp. N85]|uniref:YdcF family protein n=1 Tax=Nocardiopsis sp. N85 TaxID=3029400 RepID=UPI00237F80A4|nr:YdcF family protein [Nocardiopsis sp. N85]MDE3720132.1 YdcF family protein [Nocardiopsis sp. N85]
MRTVNGGRGDETWEDPAPDAASSIPASSEDDATRVMSRDDLPTVTRRGDTDETTVLSRGPLPGGIVPDDDPAGTRAFDRNDPAFDGLFTDPATSGSATPGPPGGPDSTRRFVHDRPRAADAVRPTGRPSTDDPGPPRRPRPPRGRRPAPRPRGRRRIRLRWIITLILVTALALPPATWGWVWYTARQDDRVATDAIVVLGASQYNGVPSPVFEARLRHAQVLYLDGVAPMIVTVGGKQPGDNFTEAAAGRNWLVEVGIPADRIIAVEEGSDTLQSIRAVSLVFDDNGWDDATLVSDPWHSLRSKVMASDHGIDSGTSPSRSGPAVIERRTQLWYITRETASLWYYWIFNDSSDIRVNAA